MTKLSGYTKMTPLPTIQEIEKSAVTFTFHHTPKAAWRLHICPGFIIEIPEGRPVPTEAQRQAQESTFGFKWEQL